MAQRTCQKCKSPAAVIRKGRRQVTYCTSKSCNWKVEKYFVGLGSGG